MSKIFTVLHSKTHFDSYYEYEQFEKNIQILIEEGTIEEIPVLSPIHSHLEEHWYRDFETCDVYRFCPPEFPARGVWEKIK